MDSQAATAGETRPGWSRADGVLFVALAALGPLATAGPPEAPRLVLAAFAGAASLVAGALIVRTLRSSVQTRPLPHRLAPAASGLALAVAFVRVVEGAGPRLSLLPALLPASETDAAAATSLAILAAAVGAAATLATMPFGPSERKTMLLLIALASTLLVADLTRLEFVASLPATLEWVAGGWGSLVAWRMLFQTRRTAQPRGGSGVLFAARVGLAAGLTGLALQPSTSAAAATLARYLPILLLVPRRFAVLRRAGLVWSLLLQTDAVHRLVRPGHGAGLGTLALLSIVAAAGLRSPREAEGAEPAETCVS